MGFLAEPRGGWAATLSGTMPVVRLVVAVCLAGALLATADAAEQASGVADREERQVRGWRVHVSRGLLDADGQASGYLPFTAK